MNQARQNVAADAVGAKQELAGAAFNPGRRRQDEIAELFVRVVRRDQIGEQRQQHDEHNKAQSGPAHRGWRKVGPEFGQRRGRFGCECFES